MIPNLTLIQTFYQVAHQGSYSAAARSLGLSYQSAANHIRRLEQVVGDKLVDSEKGGKQIYLTARGLAMYNLIHPELEIMLSRLALVISEDRPLLRIGLPQAEFYYLFPGILKQYQLIYPGIEIQTIERDTMLPELVADGSIDVCLSESFLGDATVPQSLIGTYRASLIFPTDWQAPSCSQELASWAADRPFITYEPGQTLRNIAIDYLVRSGIEPQVSISTSGSSSVKQCVNTGLGYSIIPSWCINADEANLQSMPLDDSPEISIYFGHAQFLANNPYVSTLYETCQSYISDNVPSIQC